jgi:hypothetical protein
MAGGLATRWRVKRLQLISFHLQVLNTRVREMVSALDGDQEK